MRFRIDYVKTKDSVIKYMEDYELLRFKFHEDALPTMTQEFLLICPSKTNTRCTSSTEKTALKNIELESKLQEYRQIPKIMVTLL